MTEPRATTELRKRLEGFKEQRELMRRQGFVFPGDEKPEPQALSTLSNETGEKANG